MLTEAPEAFGDLAAAALDDVSDNGPGIVKPDLCGNTADVLKHRGQPFQEALHVFAVVQLEISAITVWKAENKIFCLMA